MLTGQFFLCFLLVLPTIFFGWEFVFRYGLVYNETGRYFDEKNAVTYHAQAAPVYGAIFVFCLVALAMMCRWTLKTVRMLKST